MTSQHALVVNTEGIMEVLHSTHPIDMDAWLTRRGEGVYASLAFRVADTDETGRIHLLVNPTGDVNERAQAILARLSGAHMILTGTVAFTGLTVDQVLEIVRDFG